MAWLLEHVTDVVTKYLTGTDGKAPYDRLFGIVVHEEELEFGERVMWKKRRQYYNVVIDPRWELGFWLGRNWGSTVHRVLTAAGDVIEVRAVAMVPASERWQRDALHSALSCLHIRPAPATRRGAARATSAGNGAVTRAMLIY